MYGFRAPEALDAPNDRSPLARVPVEQPGGDDETDRESRERGDVARVGGDDADVGRPQRVRAEEQRPRGPEVGPRSASGALSMMMASASGNSVL